MGEYEDLSQRQKTLLKGSILHKRSILRRLEEGKLNISTAALELGIEENSVRKLMKERDAIMSFSGDPSKKRKRVGKYDELEQELLGWIDNMTGMLHQTNVGASSSLIRCVAMRIAKEKGLEEFKAGTGWYYRFVSRHNLLRKCLRGSGGDVNLSECAEELKALREQLEDFSPDCIFNMDETGLFYR
jgi:hypothetical protein